MNVKATDCNRILPGLNVKGATKPAHLAIKQRECRLEITLIASSASRTIHAQVCLWCDVIWFAIRGFLVGSWTRSARHGWTRRGVRIAVVVLGKKVPDGFLGHESSRWHHWPDLRSSHVPHYSQYQQRHRRHHRILSCHQSPCVLQLCL